MAWQGRLPGQPCPRRLSFVARVLILEALVCAVGGSWSLLGNWRNWRSCDNPVDAHHPSRSARILLGNTSNSSSVSDDTDPCISQELRAGMPYNLGIVTASNRTFRGFAGHSSSNYGGLSDPVVVRHWFSTSTWIIRQESSEDKPCNHMLRDPENEFANFQLVGDKQTVLKIPPSQSTIQALIDGQAAMRNGTTTSCCNDVMMAYNSHGHQVPFLTRDLSLTDPSSPEHFRGAVVTSQLVITSNFQPDKTPAQDVFFSEPIPVATTNTSLCKQCIRCRRWNATEFLGPELSGTVDASLLNFQCVNNTQCAWSPGLCNACLDGLYSGNPMPQWFGRFVMTKWPETPSSSSTPYNSSQTMTAADKEAAERRACDTFCSTYYEIWFSGIDSQGSLMLSQPSSMISIVLKRPFRALAIYQYLFGISNALIDSLEAVELI